MHAPPSASSGRGFDRWLLLRLRAALGNPDFDLAVRGSARITCTAAPLASVTFASRATLLSVLTDPWVRFGDAYSAGDVQIDGDLLMTWLPTIFQRATELARRCKARSGFVGALIEDKNSGTVLLQHGGRQGWPVAAIDSTFTALGKDERAIAVSGHAHQEKVKISQYAHDKQTLYKEQTQNHFVTQFFGYQIGVKNQADDLFDAGVYGIAAALGNDQGF